MYNLFMANEKTCTQCEFACEPVVWLVIFCLYKLRGERTGQLEESSLTFSWSYPQVWVLCFLWLKCIDWTHDEWDMSVMPHISFQSS